jgi:hypothetical protein
LPHLGFIMHGSAWLEGLKNERGVPRPEKPKNVYQSGPEVPTIYLFIYFRQRVYYYLSKAASCLN